LRGVRPWAFSANDFEDTTMRTVNETKIACFSNRTELVLNNLLFTVLLKILFFSLQNVQEGTEISLIRSSPTHA
jgi:hypothetical protein